MDASSRTFGKKKGLINPKNKDGECFKWCVTRAFFQQKSHPERVNDELKRQSNVFDWNGISFPTDWRDIDRFEKNNNISVNVFGWTQGKVYIARKTRQKINRHVNLLLLKKNEKKKHFCLISNLSRLLRRKNQRNERIYCDNCLNSIPKVSFEKHKEFCETFDACKTVPPKKADFIQFKKSNINSF